MKVRYRKLFIEIRQLEIEDLDLLSIIQNIIIYDVKRQIYFFVCIP